MMTIAQPELGHWLGLPTNTLMRLLVIPPTIVQVTIIKPCSSTRHSCMLHECCGAKVRITFIAIQV